MSMQHPICIIGAGIAGLTAAIALAREGNDVCVLERTGGPLETGAGIQLGPNAVQILDRLDVTIRSSPLAHRTEQIEIMDGLSNKRLASLPVGPRTRSDYGADYVTIHRQDLIDLLWNKAEDTDNITLRTHFDVQDLVPEQESNILTSATGENVKARFVIVADGIWSRTRQKLFATSVPQYAGKSAYRALVPLSEHDEAHDLLTTRIWLAPQVHLVHYPVRGGSLLNIVAIVDEAARSPDWSRPADFDQILPHFTNWPYPLVELLESAPVWNRWSLAELEPVNSWFRKNILLIGDAAHPVLPFLAQGGGLAIEDGFEIALHLARSGTSSKGENDITAVCQAFENSRRPRVQRVQAASQRNGTIYHMQGLARFGRNQFIQQMGGERLLRQYDWLYTYRPQEK
ncbi:MAG: FAD-dependent oxidoreductase [Methyloligellaceae bacterium]